jgi:hypothetical protein
MPSPFIRVLDTHCEQGLTDFLASEPVLETCLPWPEGGLASVIEAGTAAPPFADQIKLAMQLVLLIPEFPVIPATWWDTFELGEQLECRRGNSA